MISGLWAKPHCGFAFSPHELEVNAEEWQLGQLAVMRGSLSVKNAG
jgi:hypothetical protein